MVIGYLRVSTGKQNLANQQNEIRRFADSKDFVIDSWVTEVVSGRKRERDRKLGTLLKRMKPGDTLIVTEISRLSRTLTDIMAIMGKCLAREINLYTTKEGYSFDNTINSKVLCFAFGLVAEIERNLISMRTKEALALRKAEGMVLGRKKGSFTKQKVLIDNQEEIVRMLEQTNRSPTYANGSGSRGIRSLSSGESILPYKGRFRIRKSDECSNSGKTDCDQTSLCLPRPRVLYPGFFVACFPFSYSVSRLNGKFAWQK